ncbi:hypothetical protein AVEN_254990-1, partial [Araneus ventricosus]
MGMRTDRISKKGLTSGWDAIMVWGLVTNSLKKGRTSICGIVACAARNGGDHRARIICRGSRVIQIFRMPDIIIVDRFIVIPDLAKDVRSKGRVAKSKSQPNNSTLNNSVFHLQKDEKKQQKEDSKWKGNVKQFLKISIF